MAKPQSTTTVQYLHYPTHHLAVSHHDFNI